VTDTPGTLAAKLTSEGRKLSQFLAELTEAQWKIQVYTEGSVWTIRDILAHLMTAERAFLKLFEDVRRGGAGSAEDFSIDRYNARQQQKTRELSPPELLQLFDSTRAEMAAWVAALEETDLQRTGRHPYLGPTTLSEMIKMVYIHNQVHYRDLRRALS
jgi:uncharacterized protein (TIGR03083 family)